jgi:hypothetical protein
MSDLTQAISNYATGNGAQVPNGRPMAINDITPIQAPLKRKVRDIKIRQLDHGYVVEIGCQEFAVEYASTLIAKFSEYILSPGETEEKWAEGKLFENKQHINQ